jgi:hypothetical protein
MRTFLAATFTLSQLATVSVAVAQPHVQNARLLAQPAAGSSFSVPLEVTGGTPPYSFALIEPPSGFSVDETGTLRAQKVGAGLTPLLVLVTDSTGAYEQRPLDVFAVDTTKPLTIQTPSTLLPAVTGQSYDIALSGDGGQPPFTWSSTTALPSGLTLDPTGRISGVPNQVGNFTIPIQLAGAKGSPVTASLSLRVDDGNEPLQVTVDAGAVLQPGIASVGYNITEGPVYWSDEGYSNQYVTNPSFEPSLAHRQMHFIESGTADTLQTWVMGDGFFEDPNGLYTGGEYWVLTGPASGRHGTIVTDDRIDIDAGADGGFYQRVLTLADSNPNELPTTVTSTSSLDNDVMMMESLPQADAIPPPWKVFGAAKGTVVADTSIFRTGTRSMHIAQTGAGQLGLYQGLLSNDPLWKRLRADTTYTFSVWVRQTSTSSSPVTIGLMKNFGIEDPIVQQTFSIPDDGAFHQVSISTQGHGETLVVAVVGLEGPGEVWVDDALVYESTSTTNSAMDPTSAPVSAGPYDPIPSVVADLKRSKVGTLRFWWHNSQVTMADALTRATAESPGVVHNIYADLALAEAVGAAAWFCAEKEWLPDEYAALAEYLASDDTTQGMGQLRAQQGHPAPWTATLPAVYIEYSDESWNWPFYAYPFDPWHPSVYASLGAARFNAIRSSGFKPDNMYLVLDGQLSDDFWVNGPVQADAYPSMDALDNAPYLQMPSLPFDDTGRLLLGTVAQYDQYLQATKAAWVKKGDSTQLYLYESGPQAAGGSGSTLPEDARKDSMALVGPYMDLMAQALASGTKALNQFVYQADAAWMAVTGVSTRFRLPTSYAIELWNNVAGGADELAVNVVGPTVTPVTLTPGANGAPSTYTDGAPVSSVAVHAYRAGGHVSYGLINRNAAVAYSVALPSEAGAVYAVSSLGGARSDMGALEGAGFLSAIFDVTKIQEGIRPVQQSLVGGDNLVVTVPPSGIVTVVYTADSGDAGPEAGTGATDAGWDGGDAGLEGGTGATDAAWDGGDTDLEAGASGTDSGREAPPDTLADSGASQGAQDGLAAGGPGAQGGAVVVRRESEGERTRPASHCSSWGWRCCDGGVVGLLEKSVPSRRLSSAR